MAARKNYANQLAYHRVMSLYVLAPDSEKPVSVKACSPGAFRTLMRVASTTATDPEKARSALKGLDWKSLVDRWWIINTLASEHGARIPLFSTREEGIANQPGRVAV